MINILFYGYIAGVPVVSIIASCLALICIVPFYAVAVKMTRCRALIAMRIGVVAMMGPLLWFLTEPLFIAANDAAPTADWGTVGLLCAVVIYIISTHANRMSTIELVSHPHTHA